MNGFVNNPSFIWNVRGYRAMLVEDLIYQSGDKLYVAPANFHTDFVTVPRIVWSIVSPIDDGCRRPAGLHDYLCFLRGYEPYFMPPKKVHETFYEALRSEGVSWLKARVMYHFVRTVGQIVTEATNPWNKNYEMWPPR